MIALLVLAAYAGVVLYAGPIIARRMGVQRIRPTGTTSGYEPEAADTAIVAVIAIAWPVAAIYAALAALGRRFLR